VTLFSNLLTEKELAMRARDKEALRGLLMSRWEMTKKEAVSLLGLKKGDFLVVKHKKASRAMLGMFICWGRSGEVLMRFWKDSFSCELKDQDIFRRASSEETMEELYRLREYIGKVEECVEQNQNWVRRERMPSGGFY
jgi:hypothetical protein